jgi:hypothetical protein
MISSRSAAMKYVILSLFLNYSVSTFANDSIQKQNVAAPTKLGAAAVRMPAQAPAPVVPAAKGVAVTAPIAASAAAIATPPAQPAAAVSTPEVQMPPTTTPASTTNTESQPPADSRDEGEVYMPVPLEKTSKVPDDFEFISIKPYFKNKQRLGRLTATVINRETSDLWATFEQDFGDCQDCVRGASIKGKLGIRLYGKTLQTLTVSQKHSMSIKLTSCPSGGAFINNQYICEFVFSGRKLKLTLKVEP